MTNEIENFKPVWNLYENSYRQKIGNGINKKRSKQLPKLQKLVEQFLNASISLEKFRGEINSIISTKKRIRNEKKRLWPFRGKTGMMFFNVIVRAAKEQGKKDNLTKVFRESLTLPNGESEIREKIKDLNELVEEIRHEYDDLRKVRPLHLLFVSFFWHLQEPKKYPIYTPKRERTFSDIGIEEEINDLGASYIEYWRLNQNIRTSLSEALDRDIQFWDIGHAAWNWQQDIWRVTAGSEGEFGQPWLQDGIVTIGWGSVGNLEVFLKGKIDKDQLERYDQESDYIIRQFESFYAIEEGDWILAYGSGTFFGIGQVTSSYDHEEGLLENGHYHYYEVEWRKDLVPSPVPKGKLPQPLQEGETQVWNRGGTISSFGGDKKTLIKNLMEIAGKDTSKHPKHFWSLLIERLREENLTNRQKAPTGHSLFIGGNGTGNFRTAFLFKGGYEAAVQIEMEEKSNKIFETLKQHKEKIEEELGQELEWRKKSGDNISRIAVKNPQNVTISDLSSKNMTKELVEWSMEILKNFRNIFTHLLSTRRIGTIYGFLLLYNREININILAKYAQGLHPIDTGVKEYQNVLNSLKGNFLIETEEGTVTFRPLANKIEKGDTRKDVIFKLLQKNGGEMSRDLLIKRAQSLHPAPKQGKKSYEDLLNWYQGSFLRAVNHSIRLAPPYRKAIPPNILERETKSIAHLLAGKNLIFYGPPGTGKTEKCEEIAKYFCEDYDLRTANGEWTTYDVIGGPKVEEGFRLGFLTRAVKKQQPHWLIIDEINRANLDLAFGEAFTLLDVERRGEPLIGGGEYESIDDPIHVPKSFRVLATMNSYDKALLFKLGYAFRRRFAFVEVPTPFTKEKIKYTWSEREENWEEYVRDVNDRKGRDWGFEVERIEDWIENLEREQEELFSKVSANASPKQIKEQWETVTQGKWKTVNPIKILLGLASEITEEDIVEFGYAQVLAAAKFVLAYLALTDSQSDDLLRAMDNAVAAYYLPHFELARTKLRKEEMRGETEKCRKSLDVISETLEELGLEKSKRKIEELKQGESPI